MPSLCVRHATACEKRAEHDQGMPSQYSLVWDHTAWALSVHAKALCVHVQHLSQSCCWGPARLCKCSVCVRAAFTIEQMVVPDPCLSLELAGLRHSHSRAPASAIISRAACVCARVCTRTKPGLLRLLACVATQDFEAGLQEAEKQQQQQQKQQQQQQQQPSENSQGSEQGESGESGSADSQNGERQGGVRRRMLRCMPVWHALHAIPACSWTVLHTSS